jgi:hypothetical protein
MMRSFLAVSVGALLCACFLHAPASAEDENFDCLDDSATTPEAVEMTDATVAIVNTGDGSVGNYQTRMATAGYTATLIPVNSGYATLSGYDIVLLPCSHATPAHYGTLNGLAGDYHDFVADGGKLWIGQPNPFDGGSNTATITWAPYGLTINILYTLNDCPSIIVDPAHCIAQGVTGADLPFAGDTVISMGTEWHVVAEGPSTGLPAVFIACYGDGACLVELGHPSPSSLCPYTDAGFSRMVECLLEAGGPSPTTTASWGNIKTTFK